MQKQEDQVRDCLGAYRFGNGATGLDDAGTDSLTRCDGIRPCCTQCSNVGFECKTSDKLSRRAFPRGYTESLEDRVRGLEGEVRELKDLLDEKDEKIDVLSRIHSFSPHSRKCSESLSPAASEQVKGSLRSASQEFLQIETPAPVAPSISSPNQSSTAVFIGLTCPGSGGGCGTNC